MDRKIYFIFCVHFIAALESQSLFHQQNISRLTCVPVDDNYICYRQGQDTGYSIQKNKLDELLDMSGRTIPDTHFDMQSKIDTINTPENRKVWIRFGKRSSDYQTVGKSGVSLKDMLVFAYKRFYPFSMAPNRKRPFDSISYRGQFGGFGGR